MWCEKEKPRCTEYQGEKFIEIAEKAIFVIFSLSVGSHRTSS